MRKQYNLDAGDVFSRQFGDPILERGDSDRESLNLAGDALESHRLFFIDRFHQVDCVPHLLQCREVPQVAALKHLVSQQENIALLAQL